MVGVYMVFKWCSVFQWLTNGPHFIWFSNGPDHLKTKILDSPDHFWKEKLWLYSKQSRLAKCLVFKWSWPWENWTVLWPSCFWTLRKLNIKTFSISMRWVLEPSLYSWDRSTSNISGLYLESNIVGAQIQNIFQIHLNTSIVVVRLSNGDLKMVAFLSKTT